MADNFRVSSDGLTYLFRITEDARWSDGEPLTADDYAFAWGRMRELKTRTAFLMEDVETAEALDDRTLEVRLREPRSYFPYILCSPWAFPWPRHRCEALGDDWAKPENLVGNGPFMLVEYDDDHALLRANPHWSGAHGNVGEIHFSFYPKGAQMVGAGGTRAASTSCTSTTRSPRTSRTRWATSSRSSVSSTSGSPPTTRRSRTSTCARRSRTRSTARRC